MTAEELKPILDRHKSWLAGEAGGTRADLTGADLRRAVLRSAVLTGADLRRAVLRIAVLTCADLRSADLTGADLTGADLTGADLTGADLRSADLTGADLRRADLRRAVLRRAVLTGAVLRSAKELPAIRPVADFRAALLAAVTADGCKIDMESWHICDTVHCLAGWIVTIHPEGKLLESIFDTGTAAALILNACGEAIPDFYDTSKDAEERAMNWLRTGRQQDPQPAGVSAG